MAEPPATAVPAAAPALPLGRLFPLYAAQALATGATTVSTILAALVVGNLGFESLARVWHTNESFS